MVEISHCVIEYVYGEYFQSKSPIGPDHHTRTAEMEDLNLKIFRGISFLNPPPHRIPRLQPHADVIAATNSSWRYLYSERSCFPSKESDEIYFSNPKPTHTLILISINSRTKNQELTSLKLHDDHYSYFTQPVSKPTDPQTNTMHRAKQQMLN